MNHINSVEHAIKLAHQYAANIQYPDGYWRGSMQLNNTIEAEFIFLHHILGMNHNVSYLKSIVKRILECQREDGTWGMYYGSPGDLSVTIECYFALKLSGINSDLPLMIKARDFILSQGGVEKSRVLTKACLALLGQWSWEKLPVIFPEMILLPNWFPINIYKFACWARICLVPLAIIFSQKSIFPISPELGIEELILKKEQSAPSKFSPFKLFNKLIHFYEKSPWKPGRRRAIDKATLWMFERQQRDGTWAGLELSWIYLVAFKSLGYPTNHPVIKTCMDGLIKHFGIEINGTWTIESNNSPVWDTCLMLTALMESDMDMTSSVITKAIQFLLKNQIFTGGDWQVFCPKLPPGGWAYQFVNDCYPDVCDTSEALIPIHRYYQSLPEKDEAIKNSLQKGATWLLGMQCKNGGWSLFDKDNTNSIISRINLTADFGDLLDFPSVNNTTRAIETLGELGYSYQHPQIQKAINYIFKEQEEDGSWFGHWEVNYIYGTYSVLIALHALHFDMKTPALQRGIEWLLSKQNSDGSWGEDCSTFFFIEDHGKGPATLSQTAWALMGLMAGGLCQHPAVAKGINYVCETITSEGTWDEPYYTCSGIWKRSQISKKTLQPNKPFPMGFMMRFELYRHYWPLRALGMYRRLSTKHQLGTKQ